VSGPKSITTIIENNGSLLAIVPEMCLHKNENNTYSHTLHEAAILKWEDGLKGLGNKGENDSYVCTTMCL
jgi:hypothetical protein